MIVTLTATDHIVEGNFEIKLYRMVQSARDQAYFGGFNPRRCGLGFCIINTSTLNFTLKYQELTHGFSGLF